MATITLFCQDAAGLKLGPNAEIVFSEGFADVDVDQFPDWAAWAYHSGTPHIRVVAEGEATTATDIEHTCPKCNKSFKNTKALNGHLLSHRPAATPTPKPAPVKPEAK